MTKRATPAAEKPAKKAAAPAAEKPETAHRRHFGRGWLAEAIDELCRSHNGDGAPLTVHTIRGLIKNADGDHPSTGAVSAVLQRWNEQGYVKLSKKPIAFNGFTARYKEKTLEDFLADQKAKRAKARAAAA